MKRIHTNICDEVLAIKNDCRDELEVLRGRIGLLRGHDKVLMTMYFENGNTFYQMAKLLGVNASTISRRIRKISRRLIYGEYIVCLRNRHMFNAEEMKIAKDHFLMGLSIRKIANSRKLSYYRVYHSVKRLESMVGGLKSRT